MLIEVSGRIDTVGHTANEEDVQIVSELADNIRDAVIEYQVCGNPKPSPRSGVEAIELDGTAAGYV